MNGLHRVWSVFLVGASLVGGSAAAAEPLTLSGAVARALEQNPEVNRAAQEVKAAEAQLTGASRLLRDNPRLSASAGRRSTVRGDAFDFGLELMQPLEIAGQRAARVDAAEAALLAARAELQNQRAEVAADARAAFAGVLAGQAQVRAAESAAEFARKALAAVRERLQAGASTQLDVNAALVEVGRAQRELLSARRTLIASRAELALLLAHYPRAELNLAGELEAVVEQMANGRPTDLDAAVATALNQRADLAAAKASVAAAQAQLSVANRTAVPTPAIGVGYEQEGDEQVIQGLLGVELPVFDRNQAERGTAAARLSQAKIRLDALERRIPREVTSALERLEAARAAVQVFREGVSEAAQHSVDLVQEGYRAGKLDLFQLLLIQRNALESRRGYIAALEELAAAAAELDRTLGRIPGGDSQ